MEESKHASLLQQRIEINLKDSASVFDVNTSLINLSKIVSLPQQAEHLLVKFRQWWKCVEESKHVNLLQKHIELNLKDSLTFLWHNKLVCLM